MIGVFLRNFEDWEKSGQVGSSRLKSGKVGRSRVKNFCLDPTFLDFLVLRATCDDRSRGWGTRPADAKFPGKDGLQARDWATFFGPVGVEAVAAFGRFVGFR